MGKREDGSSSTGVPARPSAGLLTRCFTGLRRLVVAVWDNAMLGFAAMFVVSAITAKTGDAAFVGGGLAVFALLLWEADRRARYWKKWSGKWQSLATTASEAMTRQSARAIQWSDFCARVQDFMPDDQREAVRSALDCAIAPDLIEAERVH